MVVNVLAKHGTRVRFPSPAPMLGIFSKITRKNLITEKVRNSEAGLYFYLVFPIAFAFLLTFVGARILNTLYPDLFIPFGSSGFRVHHFAYGFFILAISGYLALIHNGPRAKFLISLLHGFGLGLAFDEFGIWLNLRADDPARWSYDGFLIIMGLLFFIISAKRGFNMLRILWPFRG